MKDLINIRLRQRWLRSIPAEEWLMEFALYEHQLDFVGSTQASYYQSSQVILMVWSSPLLKSHNGNVYLCQATQLLVWLMSLSVIHEPRSVTSGHSILSLVPCPYPQFTPPQSVTSGHSTFSLVPCPYPQFTSLEVWRLATQLLVWFPVLIRKKDWYWFMYTACTLDLTANLVKAMWNFARSKMIMYMGLNNRSLAYSRASRCDVRCSGYSPVINDRSLFALGGGAVRACDVCTEQNKMAGKSDQHSTHHVNSDFLHFCYSVQRMLNFQAILPYSGFLMIL